MRQTSLLGDIAWHLVQLSLRPLAARLPRREDIWVFGSRRGTQFSGNPRFLFLHCARQPPPGVRVFWITRSRTVCSELRNTKLPVHLAWSAKGIAVCLVAGIHIFDHTKADINYGAAAGGLSVNLWHGIPLKRIGDDILSPRHAHQIARRERGLQRAWQRLRRPALFEAYDYTISTSPSATQRLSSALSLPPSHVAVTGYPRNDVLRPSVRTILTAQERNIAANLRATADLGERVVLYAPTFRERAEGEAPSSHLNVRSLDDVLTRHRCRMYVKLHPNDRSDLLSRDRYGRIDVITGRIDIYPLLHFFDALITDYSSIYHDYLLLDRPLLFYPYDLEQYARVTHGLYDSYDSVTPGPQARNAQELSHALDKLLGDFDAQSAQWASQRESVRRRFHEFDDQGSAQRVLEFLLSLDPAGPHRSRPSEKRVRRRNGENE